MNILEAFIKKYGQLIILILGLPCTNKSDIAKELSLDINLPTINSNDYLIPDKYTEVEQEGIKFKIYESSENYNWDKLNEDVNKLKLSGVIVYGNYIDKKKINWNIDFCYFYSMNTTLCKKKLIENKMLEFDETDNKIDIYFEKIFNPFYSNVKTEIKINKFFNIKEDIKLDDIYGETFDNLMELIQSKLPNQKLRSKTKSQLGRNKQKKNKKI